MHKQDSSVDLLLGVIRETEGLFLRQYFELLKSGDEERASQYIESCISTLKEIVQAAGNKYVVGVFTSVLSKLESQILEEKAIRHKDVDMVNVFPMRDYS